MKLKLTVICASLFACLPAVQAAVEVPPNKLIKRTKLGGHLDVQTNQLALVGKQLAACTSQPFTAEEFRRVAPRGTMTTVVTTMRNGQRIVTPSVKLPARNDKRARTVSLARYVDDINAVEKFFNQHGYTLRHGALSLRRAGERPGPVRAGACMSRDDLDGIRAAMPLIRYKLVDAPAGPVKGTVLDRHVRLPVTKPNPPGPGDVMDAIFQPGISLINEPQLTQAGLKLQNLNLIEIPGFKGARGVPAPKVMSGCPKVCTYTLGTDTFLTESALFLRDHADEVAYKVPSCRVMNVPIDQCPVPLDYTPVTHRQYWSKFIDVDFFLKNWSNACAVIQHEMGPKGGKKPELLYTSSEAKSGDEIVIEGEPAKTFFEGKLGYDRTSIKDCVLDVGSNSMFGAQFCLVYNTRNSYDATPGFKIHNDAGLKTDVSLFGYTFDLVSGSANIDWNQPVAPNVSLPVQQPVTSTTLEQTDETQHYEGPGATFPVGPIPLTVRTFADANLSVGKSISAFEPPPLVANVTGTGKIGMAVGAGTDVSLGMDAAIDAVVLSAGISGKMSLLNNTVKGGITSFINPKINELTVEKAYTFEATTMKGSISAFVEVDLLVYSERYSVDIINFPGKTKTFEPEVSKWGPAKAVIPATAGPKTICK